MKRGLIIITALLSLYSNGQDITGKLKAAIQNLEKDDQFRHAMIGFYVVESGNGKPVFQKNEETGLAPASCQKVITSVSAFELLGKNYSYKTLLGYVGVVRDGTLNGNLVITVSGDPSLGSWRWREMKTDKIGMQVTDALKKAGIKKIQGDVIIDDWKWETQATPRGWIWEDIGNYFGAGARGLNWHENQFDVILRPGSSNGDTVSILSIDPKPVGVEWVNELRTGPAGSGDQTIIYLPEDGNIAYLRGTIPAGRSTFKISGAIPNTINIFSAFLKNSFDSSGIILSGGMQSNAVLRRDERVLVAPVTPVSTIQSPTLDSLNYWFMKKSINLFGEAFIKTISLEKKKFAATDSGLALVKAFWADRNIAPGALQMLDGSGLSPANRITTKALVTVMEYARKQNWFTSFYTALPEMNGIRMKDGYISGVRAYTGFIKSKGGKSYTFSFIVNNFSGSPASAREKIWKLLDLLK